jgi:hypothetical protein
MYLPLQIAVGIKLSQVKLKLTDRKDQKKCNHNSCCAVPATGQPQQVLKKEKEV